MVPGVFLILLLTILGVLLNSGRKKGCAKASPGAQFWGQEIGPQTEPFLMKALEGNDFGAIFRVPLFGSRFVLWVLVFGAQDFAFFGLPLGYE